MLPNIAVDDARCTNPMSCYKCIQVCPTHVLGLAAAVAPQKFRETAPAGFRMRGVRFQKCTGCLDCVRACPQKAIQVTFNGG